MKGPGLPGFRKQQGSGFYKSSPIPRTAHRSPMKQGEDDEYKELKEEKRQKEINKQITNYMDLSAEEQKNVDWSQVVTKIDSEEFVNEQGEKGTKNIKETIKKGSLPGAEVEEFATTPGQIEKYLKYKQGVIDGTIPKNTKYDKKEVFLETMDVDETLTPKVKDTEWTNVGIDYQMVGQASHTVKQDKNDGTWRFKMSGALSGELSANDINDLVKSGKFKYDKKGGRILMSKDYHDNTYLPMKEMEREGEKNAEAWRDHRGEVISGMFQGAKTAMRESGIKEKNLLGKKTDEYKQAESDWIKQYKSEHPDVWNARETQGGKTKYTNYGDYPEWMRGDPNYGGVRIGIYNDDEIVKGSATTSVYSNANYYGGANLQGARPLDWTKDATTGKYVLKDNVQTMPKEEWNKLSLEDKDSLLKQQKINDGNIHNKGPSKETRNDPNYKYKDTGPTPYHILKKELEAGTMSAEDHISFSRGEDGVYIDAFGNKSDHPDVRINEKETE